MSATQAKIGFGTLFQRGDGATPEGFTTVGELSDIDGPGLELEAVEATHQESPNSAQEFIPGLINAGEVGVTVSFLETDTTQNNVRDDLLNRSKRNYRVQFPGGQKWTFSALVTSFALKAPVKDRLTAEIKLKVSGKPTIS